MSLKRYAGDCNNAQKPGTAVDAVLWVINDTDRRDVVYRGVASTSQSSTTLCTINDQFYSPSNVEI